METQHYLHLFTWMYVKKIEVCFFWGGRGGNKRVVNCCVYIMFHLKYAERVIEYHWIFLRCSAILYVKYLSWTTQFMQSIDRC